MTAATALTPITSGLVYVEYVSRRQGVELGEFHATMAAAHAAWDGAHGEDVLLWAGARTWRLGPEPEYLTVWYSPGFGLGRIDGWERIFRDGEAERHSQTVGRVSRIERAGCYRPLRAPVAARGGTYYVECFQAAGTLHQVRAHYEARARRHPDCTLNLLAHQIGGLAPPPGGLALWTIPSFAALDGLAAELSDVREPVLLAAAGTYTDVGREIL